LKALASFTSVVSFTSTWAYSMRWSPFQDKPTFALGWWKRQLVAAPAGPERIRPGP